MPVISRTAITKLSKILVILGRYGDYLSNQTFWLFFLSFLANSTVIKMHLWIRIDFEFFKYQSSQGIVFQWKWVIEKELVNRYCSFLCPSMTGSTARVVNSVKENVWSECLTDQPAVWLNSQPLRLPWWCVSTQALFACRQSLNREHTAYARWPCVWGRGRGEQSRKSFHLDRDPLSHPTASNMLKREENAMMPEHSTVNSFKPKIQITNLPVRLLTRSAWVWLQETKKPAPGRKQERRASHWL